MINYRKIVMALNLIAGVALVILGIYQAINHNIAWLLYDFIMATINLALFLFFLRERRRQL